LRNGGRDNQTAPLFWKIELSASSNWICPGVRSIPDRVIEDLDFWRCTDPHQILMLS